MIEELENLIDGLENLSEDLNNSVATNNFYLNDKSLDILKSFHEKLYSVKDIVNILGNPEKDRLNTILTSTNIENEIARLSVLSKATFKSIKNEEILETYVSVLTSDSQSLILLIAMLKSIYKKYQEKSIDTIMFDESKIDKSKLLEYLNLSLNYFEKIESFDEKEKEKIIIYYKEIIKEVEKSKPLWSKVYGMIGAISLAVSLFLDVPEATEKLKEAFNTINKGIVIEGDISKMEKMKEYLKIKELPQIENFSHT